MKRIAHQAISASAGSGKTFALAHRYIRLLANGVPPDRIAALTFSRKAAGEIFESVVHYLCEAAVSDAAARETARRVEEPGLGRDDFQRLLRVFVGQLHRLRIGTLDSLIVGIVRAFPAELGISPEFQVTDTSGTAAAEIRKEVLSAIFSAPGAQSKERTEFLQAFKQATFGREEKGAGELLDAFISDYQETYRVLPREDAWGREATIWPDGSPWLPPSSLEESIQGMRTALVAAPLPEQAAERWAIFLEAVGRYSPGIPWDRDIGYLAEKLLPLAADLRAGTALLPIGKKAIALTGEQCRHALALLRHIMNAELAAAAERTRGIFRILKRYEAAYDDYARRTGRFTFSDAQYLLTPANGQSGGATISRAAGEEGRLYIDYRLDAKLDHWLLDEFQDTSDLQWAVLRNLADEILQDDSGARSFFYVGDVKQAIYGWRGGNARLFRSILRHYGNRIEEAHLTTSFRSCRPVLDTVNRVFADPANPAFPPKTVADWKAIWKTHECRPDRDMSLGYAALLEPAFIGNDKPTAEDRHLLLARLLQEIEPLRRGLSTAVLVRSNKAGRDVVDALRRECPGLPVLHEGNAPIADNPVVTLLQSLIKFAGHPGDLFAWRHLQMSPLRDRLAAYESLHSRLPATLLREIHRAGFRTFLGHWGSELDAAAALDAYGRMRLADLLDAAGEFDAGASRDGDAFLRFVDGYEIREAAGGAAVRVMTIHQAKGLGFDVVILPDLMGRDIACDDVDMVVARDTENLPQWTLKMPRRNIAEQDPVLNAALGMCDEEAAFEELCVLYVALTRAKSGLYLITSYPGKSSESFTAAAFLKQQLTGMPKPEDGPRMTIGGRESVCLFETGRRDWYRDVSARKEEESHPAADAFPAGFASRPSRRVRLSRLEPSGEEDVVQRASALFRAETADVLDFGTAVHELFAKVEWLAGADAARLTSDWAAHSEAADDVKRDACDQFRKALNSDAAAQSLARPPGDVVLWREKSFEVVLDSNRWVSGIFDRVTIECDAQGRVTQATILDYKSDRIASTAPLEPAVKRYRPQLDLYRKALARILSIPPKNIRLMLFFTRPLKLAEV